MIGFADPLRGVGGPVRTKCSCFVSQHVCAQRASVGENRSVSPGSNTQSACLARCSRTRARPFLPFHGAWKDLRIATPLGRLGRAVFSYAVSYGRAAYRGGACPSCLGERAGRRPTRRLHGSGRESSPCCPAAAAGGTHSLHCMQLPGGCLAETARVHTRLRPQFVWTHCLHRFSFPGNEACPG